MTRILTAIIAIWTALGGAAPGVDTYSQPFDVATAGEAVAVVHAGCGRCSWGETGREAAALKMSIDGTYSQHLLLARGENPADYRVTLGAVAPGPHTLTIERDLSLSAKSAGPLSITAVSVTVVPRASEEFMAQSMAPILHARPNTVGRFTDLPILMWYEVAPTPRGRRFQYSVIFTNEDGGTTTDRLMATWGRTTDIEFVYGVEVDARGKVLAEEFQGPGHEVPAFTGRHEAAHPLLWVSTDNNMVSESGVTTVRYAPAPERIDLANVSREVVMDRHPWSYAVAAQEMQREGKVVDQAAAGSGKIPDLRRYVFVEACTELDNAAIAFSVRAADSGDSRWFESDRGLREFRIVRTGCFRGAVPLPRSAGKPDAVRFRAYSRPPEKGAAQARAPGSVRLTRVNQLFTLGDDFLPRLASSSWTGSIVLPLDGDWQDVRLSQTRPGARYDQAPIDH